MSYSQLTEAISSKIVRWLSREVESPRTLPLSDFDRIRYEIRPCDVLLIEGRSRISRVIKTITQSPWSHAAIYIGRIFDIADASVRENILKHYQGDPNDQLIVESLIGQGAIISPITKYQHEHIRICRPTGLSYKDAEKIIAYTVKRLGTPYDSRLILDLGRFLLPWTFIPRRWHSTLFQHNAGEPTRLSCSMLLAEAFAAVHFPVLPLIREHKLTGIEIVQRNPRLFTPSDFDYSPFFEIIKYPMFELSEGVSYRALPWNKEGLISNDRGQLEVIKVSHHKGDDHAIV